MNKFEEICSDDHHVSSAEGWGLEGDPRSDVRGGGGCTVRSNASYVMVTWGPP